MPTTLEELLVPISENNPAGSSASLTRGWEKLTEAVREDPPGTKNEKEGPLKEADWKTALNIASEMLRTKSKDLRLATTFTEAGLMVHGLPGLSAGFDLVHALIEEYWDKGLFPEAEDGDLEYRITAIMSLPQALPFRIESVAVTSRTATGTAGTMKQYRDFSRGASSADFEQAFKDTAAADLETLKGQATAAAESLEKLEAIVDQRFKQEAPSLIPVRDAIAQVVEAFDDLIKRKTSAVDDKQPSSPSPKTAPIGELTESSNFGGSWDAAEQLLRSGKVSEGLADLTKLASMENGRARFLRRIRLAEFCVSSNREKLAVAILEELTRDIERLGLAAWESGEILGRVWGRLYRIYKVSKNSDHVERAAVLFDLLCRLDPWQAFRWDE